LEYLKVVQLFCKVFNLYRQRWRSKALSTQAAAFSRRPAKVTLVAAFVACCITQPGYAQPAEDENKPIRILHRQLDSKSIPQIGNPMRLEVELLNTFDITSSVRLVGAKDGRFIDIAFPRGALNAADRPTFQIEIPSPIAAMTYQFVVHQRNGSLSSSEKFTIKRDCIQNFKVVVPEDVPNTEFRREISTLVSQAKILERDTASLEASLKLVEDIKASLAN
jgi:hypothetical protein